MDEWTIVWMYVFMVVVCVYVCMDICIMYVYIYMCMYVCMYVCWIYCVCVCMHCVLAFDHRLTNGSNVLSLTFYVAKLASCPVSLIIDLCLRPVGLNTFVVAPASRIMRETFSHQCETIVWIDHFMCTWSLMLFFVRDAFFFNRKLINGVFIHDFILL